MIVSCLSVNLSEYLRISDCVIVSCIVKDLTSILYCTPASLFTPNITTQSLVFRNHIILLDFLKIYEKMKIMVFDFDIVDNNLDVGDFLMKLSFQHV